MESSAPSLSAAEMAETEVEWLVVLECCDGFSSRLRWLGDFIAASFTNYDLPCAIEPLK
jgi:hypothetical protein